MKKRISLNCTKSAALLFSIFLILNTASYADVVILKNGTEFNGQVKKTEEGVWIDGVLFQEDEIEEIKDTPLEINIPSKVKPWRTKMPLGLGADNSLEARKKADLKAYHERIRRNEEAMRARKRVRPSEIQKSQSNRQEVLRRAQRIREQKKTKKTSTEKKGSFGGYPSTNKKRY